MDKNVLNELKKMNSIDLYMVEIQLSILKLKQDSDKDLIKYLEIKKNNLEIQNKFLSGVNYV